MKRTRQRPDILKGASGRLSHGNLLGAFVANRRLQLGLTKEEFLPYLSPRELARIEKGSVKRVRNDTLIVISNFLDMPYEALRAKRDAGDIPRIYVDRVIFSDGVDHDDFVFILLNRLRKMSGVKIIEARSVRDELANATDKSEICEYVLSIAVVFGKHETTTIAELMDSASGEAIWSEELHNPVTAGDAAQIAIANSLARALKVATFDVLAVASFHYRDLESTEALARGWGHIYKMPMSPSVLDQAQAEFEAILLTHPDNPYALAGLAIAHLNHPLNGWPDEQDHHRKLGEELAFRAVKDGPRVAEAHFALGLAYRSKRDLHGARRAFSDSIKLDPSLVGSLTQIALIEMFLGHPRKAIKQVQAAMLIRSDDPGRAFLAFVEGVSNLYLERYADAVRILEEAMRLNPNLVDALFFLCAAYQGKGDVDKAKITLANYIELRPGITIDQLRHDQPSQVSSYQPYIERVYESLALAGMA